MGAGIVFANLLFTITERVIVIRRIDRKDTPHLTLSFNNASNEIDLHFKYESARNDPSSIHTPLLRITKAAVESYLANLVSDFEREFVGIISRNIKFVRPGWLGRKGYLIAWQDSGEIEKQIIESAPKIRRKHRVDIDKLKKVFNEPDISKINFAYSSELHKLSTSKNKIQVFAIHSRGKRPTLFLSYIRRSNDKYSWFTVHNKLKSDGEHFFDSHISQDMKLQAKSLWEKIYSALRLDEIGFIRD
jgi:hypothetical protein